MRDRLRGNNFSAVALSGPACQKFCAPPISMTMIDVDRCTMEHGPRPLCQHAAPCSSFRLSYSNWSSNTCRQQSDICTALSCRHFREACAHASCAHRRRHGMPQHSLLERAGGVVALPTSRRSEVK